MKLEVLVEQHKQIRVIGFDDTHHRGLPYLAPVNLAGVICSKTRFEGMVWGSIHKDGMDATEQLISLVDKSKFAEQLHVILLDGISFGGCNIVDIQEVHQRLGLPVATLMRRQPNMERFHYVIDKLPEPEQRKRLIDLAGTIHELRGFFFQVAGEEPEIMARVLENLTDQGKVPEALRLAHLIGSAVMLGESGKRA